MGTSSFNESSNFDSNAKDPPEDPPSAAKAPPMKASPSHEEAKENMTNFNDRGNHDSSATEGLGSHRPAPLASSKDKLSKQVEAI